MKQLVKAIHKREGVEIHISSGVLPGGYSYGEIRQVITTPDGSIAPTHKGLTFTPAILDEIIEGLTELRWQLSEYTGR